MAIMSNYYELLSFRRIADDMGTQIRAGKRDVYGGMGTGTNYRTPQIPTP
jgi:hypothetical protein